MRQQVSLRILITTLLMLGTAVGGVFGLSLWDRESEPAQGSEPQVLVFAGGDLGAFGEFDSIASASRVTSIDEVRAATQGAPAVIVIDSALAANLKSGDLRFLVNGGSTVVGLNIPLGELNELTGFEDELRSLNPRFAGQLPTQDATRSEPFYSLVWRTPEGSNPAYWGRLQHSLSDGLFTAVINRQKLAVQGLIADDGNVIPIEEYGQD